MQKAAPDGSPTSPNVWRHHMAVVAPVVILAAAMLIQASWFREVKSTTFDETFYLSCALQTAHDGRWDKRAAQDGVAPLPLMIAYLVPAWRSGGMDRPDPWQADRGDPAVIREARLLNASVVGVGLILVVYFWLWRRRGIAAAATGAIFVTFSPSMLAHVSLATTDACFALFALIALAAIAWYRARPSFGRLVALVVAVSAAVSAKYSGVFLFPTLLVLFLIDAWRTAPDAGVRRTWNATRSAAGRFTVVVLLAVPVVWGFHLFAFTGPLKTFPLAETPDSSPWVELIGNGPRARQVMDFAHTRLKRPAPLTGLLFQYLHNRRGHGAFLMGARSETGWWYYFPIAWCLKSTAAELALAALLLVMSAAMLVGLWSASRGTPLPAERERDLTPGVWWTAMIVFGVLISTARINIGHRYVLLFYPLLFLAVTDRLWEALADRKWLLGTIAAVAVVAQAASALVAAPHYLAYFSPLVGGPSQGYRYLIDSSLDWGQDLPQLATELDRLGFDRVLLNYFGTAMPESYGVTAERFDEADVATIEAAQALAISASPLQGLYVHGDDPFAAFRDREPIARAGHSIFIYDLSDPATKALAVQAAADIRAGKAAAGL